MAELKNIQKADTKLEQRNRLKQPKNVRGYPVLADINTGYSINVLGVRHGYSKA